MRINGINSMTHYYLFFMVFFIGLQNAYGLSLSATVDRKAIALNESLQLVITADRSVHDTIDFSQLSHQFEVLNSQRSSQTQIDSRGKISATTQWTLILAPKESGRLLIPSFELRGSYSPAIGINVAKNKRARSQDLADVFLELTTNKKAVYVQEQLLVTFRLYYKVALSNANAEEFTLSNSTIEAVAENSFSTQLKGKQYQVLEKVYSVHPQASGPLAIPAQSWRLEKPSRSFFGRATNPYLHVKTQPISIQVKPIPPTSTADHWLPSTALTLASQGQDAMVQAKVGEPLNYSLVLSGDGLTAAQLPNISLPDIEHFTIYSEQAKTDQQISAKGIIGQRTYNFAIIPRKAGEFTLPEIRLRWWNINTDKEETLVLPAKAVVVTPGQVQADNQSLPTLATASPDQASPTHLWLWQLLSLVLALICCGLVALLIFSRKSFTTGATDTTVTPAPHQDNNHFKALQQAANNGDWQQLRRALIRWAQHQYNDDPSLNSLRPWGKGTPNSKAAYNNWITNSTAIAKTMLITLRNYCSGLRHVK